MKFRFFIFAIFLLPCFFGSATACSCYANAPCQEYQNTDVIFFGKAIEMKQLENNEYEMFFEIAEAFKNTKTGEKIHISSNLNEGICGYRFELNQTYLVFANRGKKGLWTGSCYGNMRGDYAAEYLSYLRNAVANGIETKIEGRIKETGGRLEPSFAVTDVKIKAQQIDGDRQIFYGEIEENGDYKINVPAGTYLITLELPNGFEFAQRRRSNNEPVQVTSQKCGSVFFIFGNKSEITGKVVNANGKTIKDLKIELVSVNSKDKEKPIYEADFSDEKGLFEFRFIPLGKYFLSVNYTNFPKNNSPFPVYFYPQTDNLEKAEIIEISNGTKINNIVFQIPSKSEVRKVSGSVFDNKGNPIKEAQVFLRDEELKDWLNPSGIKTNANGSFEIEAFDGRKYKIMVLAMRKNQIGVTNAKATTNVFTLDKTTQKFKIIVPISIKE